MRYLVGEASWPATELSARISESGTLVTRTDTPEDLPLYLEMCGQDLAIVDEGMISQGIRLSRLRSLAPKVPLVVLSARPDPDRRIAFYASGADLVIDGAETPEALLSRLCAVARRAHSLSEPVIRLGPLSLDLMMRRAALYGNRLALAPKLYETLEYLALRQGQTISRDALLSHVYEPGEEPRARVFDVYMNTLRGLLSQNPAEISIVTHRGLGFRLECRSLDATAALALERQAAVA